MTSPVLATPCADELPLLARRRQHYEAVAPLSGISAGGASVDRVAEGLARGSVTRMDTLLSADNLVALVTLTVLEIVLGIDNVIFISILSGKLPHADQARARRTGL